MTLRFPTKAALAIAFVVLLANAPLLDDFARLLAADELAASALDAATHYLRMLHARELYLASGHHLGWDPFWYQGYVPFLLYPHLTYVLLALVSMAVPADPARVFNAYTLVLYLALPLAAGFLAARSKGLAAAAVLASWFAVLSSPGAGLTGVFSIGLLSQQAGVLLFVALAYDVIVARRLDRAAIWLGLLPLVHVHGSLVAAFAWLAAGLVALLEKDDRASAVRGWIEASLLALLIASPTVFGLVLGSDQVGESTTFSTLGRPFLQLLRGDMVLPTATLAALGLCLAAAATVVPRSERVRFRVWMLVALLLFVVSIHKWSVGLELPDRVLGTMLYLRTLPFAVVWMAFLVVDAWQRLRPSVLIVVMVLSVVGIVTAWPGQAKLAPRIGTSWRSGSMPESFGDYRAVLDWVAADVAGETATLVLFVHRPRAYSLFTAIERCGLPVIGGHGPELTSVRNTALLDRTLDLTCEVIQRQVRDYAVGYFVGTEDGHRSSLEYCLGAGPAIERGDWWVFATGNRWGETPGLATGFRHDPTWTELEWTLGEPRARTRMRLPMANTAPWTADVDGMEVAVESTDDRMMRVTVPAGAKRLRLRYEGYRWEWPSVVLSLVALAFAVFRVSRHRPKAIAGQSDGSP